MTFTHHSSNSNEASEERRKRFCVQRQIDDWKVFSHNVTQKKTLWQCSGCRFKFEWKIKLSERRKEKLQKLFFSAQPKQTKIFVLLRKFRLVSVSSSRFKWIMPFGQCVNKIIYMCPGSRCAKKRHCMRSLARFTLEDIFGRETFREEKKIERFSRAKVTINFKLNWVNPLKRFKTTNVLCDDRKRFTFRPFFMTFAFTRKILRRR